LDVTTHPHPQLPTVTLGRSPAVRAAAHRALAARDLLVSGYPHWETWRRQARASKTEAIARLDEFLNGLERAVTAWGGRVLRARDAAQARRMILAVAREHGVKTVVKAKSMTTEEIGLNPALAAANLQVMETDLGEFIVQLAGHPPAHLTAPALHLNRRQIADLFAAYPGLRSPAEPKVHLAVMGLEKIIPRLSDLEPMLRLLPASATGQRLTALVHFIQGLRLQPQGPQIFYLVILDNGRRRLAADPELSEALYCLRCGACLNVCPVFQVGAAHLYGRVYPGAIGILLAPYLAPLGDICDLCTQCGACQDICPVGIRLTDHIRRLRRHSRRFRPLRALTAAAGAVLSRPRWYRGLEPAARRLTGLASRYGRGASGFTSLSPESFHRRHSGPRPQIPLGGEDRGGPPPPLRRAPSALAPDAGGVVAPAHPDLDSAIALLAQRLREAGSSLAEVRGPAALARRLAAAAPPLWLEDHPWLQPVAQELEKLEVPTHLARADWTPVAGTAVTLGLGAIPETGSVLVDSGGGAGAVLAFRAENQIILLPRNSPCLTPAQALNYVQRRGPGLVSWLTGPSRTADIEKVLVLGAQGPSAIEVILYQEEA
jgi:L-lactate dehydrogenase complex protein LldF